MRFLRQAALLLPSAFLLVVLMFLLTHGRTDPGFGAYPFFQEWAGDAPAAPEWRFLQQALVFFAPAYAVTLAFVLAVVLGEKALFGPRKARPPSAYGRAFQAIFPVLFLVASAAVMWFGESAALRQAPGTLIAPLLAALSPFAGAVLAVLPSAVIAGPAALVGKLAGA